MDLDHQHLSYIFHEGLYLLEEPGLTPDFPEKQIVNETPVAEKAEKLPIKYRGANEKGVLFIVSDLSSDFLNAKEYGFLMRIVESGLRMSELDIGVVNVAYQDFQQVINEVPFTAMIGFGIPEISSMASDFQYVVQEIDGKKILAAEFLSVIESDTDKKRQLWNALQVMFDIQKTRS